MGEAFREYDAHVTRECNSCFEAVNARAWQESPPRGSFCELFDVQPQQTPSKGSAALRISPGRESVAARTAHSAHSRSKAALPRRGDFCQRALLSQQSTLSRRFPPQAITKKARIRWRGPSRNDILRLLATAPAARQARISHRRSRTRPAPPLPSPRACAIAARRECPARWHGSRISAPRP